jgi:S1-C subfamily serine protease
VPVQLGNSGGALVDERGNVIGIVSAKLDASAALAASGALPENVNYAVKSSFLLSFLESVPAVSAKLKPPVTADRKFEDVVKSAQDAPSSSSFIDVAADMSLLILLRLKFRADSLRLLR